MAVTRQCIHKGTFRGDFTGPNPTERGKLGTKRHVLTDKKGIPLSVIITAANTHDTKAATEMLDSEYSTPFSRPLLLSVDYRRDKHIREYSIS